MLQIQEQYGLYTVMEHLAVGEERACCKAMDPFVGQDMILQLIKLPERGNGERLEEFEQRLDTLAELNHPALAPIYDIGRESGLCYYTTEFYPSGRFSQQFTEQEALEFLRQLTEALAYAHKKGFEHGLFTTDEIFQKDNGQPVLVGFGIAELLNSLYSLEDDPATPHQVPSLAQKQSFYSLGALFLSLVLTEEQQTASQVDQVVQLKGYREKQLITALLGFSQEAITSYDELMRRLAEMLPGADMAEEESDSQQDELSVGETETTAPSSTGPEVFQQDQPSLDLSDISALESERVSLQGRLDDLEHAKLAVEQKQLETEQALKDCQLAMQGARQEAATAWELVDKQQSQTCRPVFLMLCGCLAGVFLAGGLIFLMSALLEGEPVSEASTRVSIQRIPAAVKMADSLPVEESGTKVKKPVDGPVAAQVENVSQPAPPKPAPAEQKQQEVVSRLEAVTEKAQEPAKEQPEVRVPTSEYIGDLQFHIDLATDLSGAEKGKILAALEGWASAWTKQNIADYLDYYSVNYEPDGGRSREEWQNSRQVRIKRPAWIKVQLDDLQISTSGVDQVQIWLKQVYRSDTYGDQTLKAVEMVREAGGWKILAERSFQEGG